MSALCRCKKCLKWEKMESLNDSFLCVSCAKKTKVPKDITWTHVCIVDEVRALERCKCLGVEGKLYIYTYNDLGNSVYYQCSFCPMCGEKARISQKEKIWVK